MDREREGERAERGLCTAPETFLSRTESTGVHHGGTLYIGPWVRIYLLWYTQPTQPTRQTLVKFFLHPFASPTPNGPPQLSSTSEDLICPTTLPPYPASLIPLLLPILVSRSLIRSFIIYILYTRRKERGARAFGFIDIGSGVYPRIYFIYHLFSPALILIVKSCNYELIKLFRYIRLEEEVLIKKKKEEKEVVHLSVKPFISSTAVRRM